MAVDIPDVDFESQDLAEVFDETHLDEDGAEFATLEDMPDVFDATTALGDSRDLDALDAADVDPAALDDEDPETDEDLDDSVHDALEDEPEDDEIDEEDLDTEDAVNQLEPDEPDLEPVADLDQIAEADEEEADDYESETLSDEDLVDLGYGKDDSGKPQVTGPTPEDVPDEADPHQDELLDEGVEETFPASDPVSVKRIT